MPRKPQNLSVSLNKLKEPRGLVEALLRVLKECVLIQFVPGQVAGGDSIQSLVKLCREIREQEDLSVLKTKGETLQSLVQTVLERASAGTLTQETLSTAIQQVLPGNRCRTTN